MWLKFLKNKLIKGGFLTKDDLHLFTIVKSSKKAIQAIEKFYSTYHSIRYSKDLTIIRLNRQLTAGDYKVLNKKFKSLLTQGEIEPCEALPVEKKNGEFPHLPRLKMYFNHKSYAKLMMMVREINSL